MYGGRPPAGGGPTRRGWLRRYGPYIALGLVVLISGVLAYVLYTLRDVPDPGKAPALSRTVTVYDRKGRVIETHNDAGEFYVNLHLAQMGGLNKYATLAAEDRDFYQHPAIDFARTAAAAASDVLHRGNLQGGSTITQQLVKISVLTPQRSVFRKMQEATLAFGLESQYSKDQILEMYLNRVFYGHNAYGIGAATRVYFGAGKQPTDLTAGQAAFLAGLINGPSYYDPQVNYDGAKQRQLYVLDGMVKKGWLTQAQADQAAQEDIKAELKYDVSSFKSLAPHFVRYVLGVVESQLQGQAEQGNINVYTTLDLDLQAQAEKAVTNAVASARFKREGVNNGDLMAVKPGTGEILAYVGSADFNDGDIAGQVDVIHSKRQPGSTFKPYVYEAALKDGKITLASTLHDVPTNFGNGPYWPKDWDYPKTPMGNITPRTSLVESRNITAVETAQLEGIDNVIRQAQAQGINSKLDPNLSTAIGGSDITMFEQMQGYQVFANQGTLMPLMGVTKVTDDQNNVLYDQQPGSQPNISHPITPAQAYLITDVLKDYNKTWGLGWKRTMAGKSGTTGANDQYHQDAWMMAYNPDILIGGWTGNTSPNTVNNGGGYCPPSQPHCTNPGAISAFGTETGEFMLAPFINGLPSGMNDWYKRPDGIVTGGGCSGNASEIFLAGTQGGANCPSPSPTPTPSVTPTPTPTVSESPSPTIRPTTTPTPTPTHTPTPGPSPT